MMQKNSKVLHTSLCSSQHKKYMKTQKSNILAVMAYGVVSSITAQYT